MKILLVHFLFQVFFYPCFKYTFVKYSFASEIVNKTFILDNFSCMENVSSFGVLRKLLKKPNRLYVPFRSDSTSPFPLLSVQVANNMKVADDVEEKSYCGKADLILTTLTWCLLTTKTAAGCTGLNSPEKALRHGCRLQRGDVVPSDQQVWKGMLFLYAFFFLSK